jgi:hypothetical protein
MKDPGIPEHDRLPMRDVLTAKALHMLEDAGSLLVSAAAGAYSGAKFGIELHLKQRLESRQNVMRLHNQIALLEEHVNDPASHMEL